MEITSKIDPDVQNQDDKRLEVYNNSFSIW